MLQHPEDGIGAVFDGCRERVFGGSSVVDRYHDGMAFIGYGTTPTGIVRCVPDREAATVEIYESGVVAPGVRLAGLAPVGVGGRGVEEKADIARGWGKRGGDGAGEEWGGGGRGPEVVE